ncbi:MAG: hypothetical protein AW07_03916 [Candidatus Accumulibacter sp. SK-11]|nr:MAG: hypothetical protein AW07_03916 [Candidatus Accumulibacter sp. SK-11]
MPKTARRRLASGGIEQSRQHHRHQRDVTHRLFVDVAPDRRRGKTAVQQERRAGPQAAMEQRHATDVVQRQTAEPDVTGRQRQALLRRGDCGGEIAGRQHHRLRLSLAAAGGDDQRQVVCVGSSRSQSAVV